ncbi:hypothetical protein LTR08_007906 [Meristemomyces frigidus]|nr:hypothetical protein LTR08_007906 [Meristemomyces frigidus]
MSQTVHITSPTHLSQLLTTSRIVVADFYADWCGPCKAIAPVYEALSAQLSRPRTITFVKINTDTQPAIAQSYNITAMPTFMLFKAGRETQRIRGADPKALDAAVKALAHEAGRADEDGAAASSAVAGASGAWAGATVPKGYADITDSVDQLGLDFLNLDSDAGGARSIFDKSRPSALAGKGAVTAAAAAGGKKDWIESDTDEQLMLFIPFQSSLKLHSLHITSLPPTSSEADEEEEEEDKPMRPKTLKLYTNRATVLGFDEADDHPCTQQIALAPADWDPRTGTAKVELRFVKFQNISSLVVFVVDGEGRGEKVRVDRVRFVGETGESRKMGRLEKVGDEGGE